MDIMSSRCERLLFELAGLHKTGIDLIGYDGKNYFPGWRGDDIGFDFFVVKMAGALNIPFEQSLVLFLGIQIFLSLSLGILGCFLLYKSSLQRVLCVFYSFLIFKISLIFGDIYLTSSTIIFATIPLFIYLVNKEFQPFTAIYLFVSGMGTTIAHFILSYSGTAPLILMVFYLIFYCKLNWKQKSIYGASLFIGMLIPCLFFNHVLAKRDLFLEGQNSNYRKLEARHVPWHSIYIGLGFLNNDYGIEYLDENAIKKVRQTSPDFSQHLTVERNYEGIFMPEYDAVLKNEVMKLIIYHPLFFIRNLFAKAGIIFLYIILFANIGLIAALAYPKAVPVESSFWLALGFSSLFGLLVVPRLSNLMGLCTFASIYGIISINHAIDQGLIDRVLSFFNRGESSSSVVRNP